MSDQHNQHQPIDSRTYRKNKSLSKLLRNPILLVLILVGVVASLIISAKAAGRLSIRFSLSGSTTDSGRTFNTTEVPVDIASWLTREDPAPINPIEGTWAAGTLGNFRILCWASHLNYDDPIVFPVDSYPNGSGQGKAHLHLFFGNRSANYQTTTSNIASKGDGSCQGGPLNRTAYWIPALLDANNKARIPYTTVFYYKTNGLEKTSVKPYPTGLRMITGDSKARSPQNNWRLQWQCITDGVKYSVIPTCQVGHKLKLEVSFPQCGARNPDGTPVLDSPDHKSHMAYREYNNVCPITHPIPYSEVSLNIIWNNTDITTKDWYISSDHMIDANGVETMVAGGSTIHADWFMGWKPEIMETFTKRCLHEGRNSNQGNLCDGTKLKMISGPNGGEYTGPSIVDPPASKSGQVDMLSTF